MKFDNITLLQAKFAPKKSEASEAFKIESKALKETPEVVKEPIVPQTISNKVQERAMS